MKGEGGLAKLEMSHLSYLIISKNIYQIFMKNFHKFCLKNVISRGGPLNFLDKTDSNGWFQRKTAMFFIFKKIIMSQLQWPGEGSNKTKKVSIKNVSIGLKGGGG